MININSKMDFCLLMSTVANDVRKIILDVAPWTIDEYSHFGRQFIHKSKNFKYTQILQFQYSLSALKKLSHTHRRHIQGYSFQPCFNRKK